MKSLTTITLFLIFTVTSQAQITTKTIQGSFFFEPDDLPEVSCGDFCSTLLNQKDENGEMIAVFLNFIHNEKNGSWEISYEGDTTDLFVLDENQEYHVNSRYEEIQFNITLELIEGKDEIGTYKLWTLKSISRI